MEMNDEEFFRYVDRDIWNIVSKQAQAEASDKFLSAILASVAIADGGKKFGTLIREKQYDIVNAIIEEAADRMMNELKGVIKNATGIAADMYEKSGVEDFFKSRENLN